VLYVGNLILIFKGLSALAHVLGRNLLRLGERGVHNLSGQGETAPGTQPFLRVVQAALRGYLLAKRRGQQYLRRLLPAEERTWLAGLGLNL
jgi:hypothetical protein